jgi:hypothetical protein
MSQTATVKNKINQFLFKYSTTMISICDALQDYAKGQEEKHKRKIILPCVIPWEYGSNKFASQKGAAGFGTSRAAVTKIESTKELSESNDGVVPWVTCPDMRKQGANQSGSTPFGGIREHVRRTQVRAKI